MAYVKPTVSDFTTRFPIFADSPEGQIQALLDEAANSIDESWFETDYKPAIMYLAAHLLATDNSEEGDTPEIGGASSGVIASESFGGGMSVSYATPAAPAAGSLSSSERYGTTVYGRRFLTLLRVNKPSMLVV